MNTLSTALCLAALTALTVGCNRQSQFTRAEATEALEETRLSTEAHALTNQMVVLTTDFTLGESLAAAVENLADFVRSQVPCADVQRSLGEVVVDFGVDGACEWKGRAWTGRTAVTVEAVGDEVRVTHAWTALSDGHLTVDGAANVTWSASERSRRVVHNMSWTDGERTGSAGGDRTQTLLDGGGIRIDGTRSWTGTQGKTWQLGIEGVEMRGIDPLPQAGVYVLTTPADKALSMMFERVDAVTIQVTISAGEKDFEFQVRSVE